MTNWVRLRETCLKEFATFCRDEILSKTDEQDKLTSVKGNLPHRITFQTQVGRANPAAQNLHGIEGKSDEHDKLSSLKGNLPQRIRNCFVVTKFWAKGTSITNWVWLKGKEREENEDKAISKKCRKRTETADKVEKSRGANTLVWRKQKYLTVSFKISTKTPDKNPLFILKVSTNQNKSLFSKP